MHVNYMEKHITPSLNAHAKMQHLKMNPMLEQLFLIIFLSFFVYFRYLPVLALLLENGYALGLSDVYKDMENVLWSAVTQPNHHGFEGYVLLSNYSA